VITQFLDRQFPGNKQVQSRMLYRRMRLICGKSIREMNISGLEKVWVRVKKEYGSGE